MAATGSTLRGDFRAVLSKYDELYPSPKYRLGLNAVECLHAKLVVPLELEDYLNKQLLSLVSCAGEAVAGDEKAFGGYHDAENMKCARDKQPGDQIGQWYNTMCSRTCWRRSFLFRFRLFRAAKRLGVADPPALMMEKMASTMASVGAGVLVSDSLYMTQSSAVCWGHITQVFPQVRFLTSVNPRSFKPLMDMVSEANYETPGQYVVLWNEQWHECFQIHRPIDNPKEVKCTYSNSFNLVTGPADPHINPMYRVNNFQYGKCDEFNRELGGKSFKFLHHRGVSLGARDDFYITALLLDAFSIWVHFNSPVGHLQPSSFSSFCKTLAAGIFKKVNN